MRKLEKAVAVVGRRRGIVGDEGGAQEGEGGGEREDLEILDVVRYKVVFADRPEPVGVEEQGE